MFEGRAAEVVSTDVMVVIVDEMRASPSVSVVIDSMVVKRRELEKIDAEATGLREVNSDS